jgi:hypothetical protein
MSYGPPACIHLSVISSHEKIKLFWHARYCTYQALVCTHWELGSILSKILMAVGIVYGIRWVVYR